VNLLRYKPHDAAPLPYTVRPISFLGARAFVSAHHYMRGMGNSATGSYGLYDGPHLIGVLVFMTPCSERARACVFGEAHVARVTELHRLVILDVTPPNAESYFIARALNALKEAKPHLWAVVSFADSGAGHVGTIYQATNGLYYGPSQGKPSFRDAGGRARSPRQCKATLSCRDALARGWAVCPPTPKHRYCFTLPDDRRHARVLLPVAEGGLLRLIARAYPKVGLTMNGQLSLFD